MTMNGADAVLRSLEAEGVEVMFGLPGGSILPLYDAMARGTTVRHVLARHEQGAGHMAEGYARASGRTANSFLVASMPSIPGISRSLTMSSNEAPLSLRASASSADAASVTA